MIKIYTAKQCERLIRGYTPEEFYFNNFKLGVYHVELVPTRPLYSHEPKIILEAFQALTFPKKDKVDANVFCMPYNGKGWYNGLTYAGEKAKNNGRGTILMMGKTTPIPFSMTRYIFAHEFGHAVQGLFAPRWIKENEKWQSYLKFRGLSKKDKRTQWHLDAGEIIADDFRILFSPYDHDFWPHTNVPHPHKVKGLKEFLIKILQ